MKKESANALYKVLYSIIIFLGAFLTFMFQPVTGKILTPQYGGGADIWASCLLFFQFVLFAGYLLALFLNKLKPKVNAVVYIILFTASLCLFNMPTKFGSWLINIAGFEQSPLISLFASLFKYAMLPVLMLSTVSVSMQNWYTKQTGESPYILYSISNIGSFLALFLYPLIYEPLMTLTDTVKLWHNIFGLLVLLIATASVLYFINSKNDNENKENTGEKIQPKNLLYWILLSAAGTILLASYTTYVTVKILPLPMLWTLFLGLYLLTFVLCFGSEKFYKKNTLLVLVPVIALVNIISGNLSGNLNNHPIFSVLITAAMFFVFLMICNGEIYKTRPDASKLSEFYLAIAFGGVLGGFFVNIIAPLIFNNYIELPLINIIMYVFAVYLFVQSILSKKPLKISSWVKLSAAGILTIIICMLSYSEVFFFEKGVEYKFKRNFYGTILIKTKEKHNIKTITSGNTLHGAQIYDSKTGKFEMIPLTYYSDTSALAYVVEGMKNFQSAKQRPLNIGVIGLGAGAAAAYTEENDKITFYEIDPKMYEAAMQDFAFLKEAKGSVDVKMGDARIVLDKSEPQNFDVLLVDAFSSDSIPVHLITKEAFNIYKKHTKNDGIILFHISNRYLDLARMLKKITEEDNLKNIVVSSSFMLSSEQKEKERGYYKMENTYFVVFMPKNKLYDNFKGFNYKAANKYEAVFVTTGYAEDDKFLKPFTDDYSSLVRIFRIWSMPEYNKQQ